MKPILFNTEQARNILDGRKTQTRRPVAESVMEHWDSRFWDCARSPKYAPYQVGDILYVRETWNCIRTGNGRSVPFETKYWYKAGNAFEDCADEKWHPSIHMPKEAARIFLKVTDVRVDRLQNITEEDAIKEGETGVRCECLHKELGGGMYGCTDCMNTGWLEPPTMYFMYDWNAIYAKRGYSWEANPWVWVYEFEQMKGEQG